MRTVCLGMLCAALLLGMGSAQAQKSIADNPDAAVEQLLVFRLIQQANLDSSTLAEVFDGYQQYQQGMGALQEKRAALKAEIKAAIDANKGGWELSDKVNSLMALDQQIMAVNQQAIRDAGSVLDAAAQAQLYLLVSDRAAAIAEARTALIGAPAAAPAAQAVAAEAVKAPTDEEALLAGLKDFVTKLIAQDIKGAMGGVSDTFTNYQYGDKAGLQEFLQSAADMGYLSGLEVDTNEAKVKVEGEKATIYPVEIKGSFGSATLEMQLGKINGEWKLVGLDIQGV